MRALPTTALTLLILAPGATGCSLDWSGARPDVARIEDARTPDARAVDAPRPDLDAAADQPEVGVITPDAFVAPGSWKLIPAGSFTMGSPPTEFCREPDGVAETQHEVTLTRTFELNGSEVTLEQFEAVMGYKPNSVTMPKLPVHSITWHEAALYCDGLSKKLGLPSCYELAGSATPCNIGSVIPCPDQEICVLPGKLCHRVVPRSAYSGSKIYTCLGYRLPTEAEWEYAYRAEKTSAFHNGKDPSNAACSGCTVVDPGLDPIGWYCANSGKNLQQGGSPKLANAWGLHNMAGNIREWCHDGYINNLGKAPVTDPVTPLTTVGRAVRGAMYNDSASQARAAARAGAHAAQPPSKKIGLRCARTVDSPDAGP